MRYTIHHKTIYHYDRPVTFASHVVRLRPRCDVAQTLHTFSMNVTPTPSKRSESIDLDGNALIRLYFPDQASDTLVVSITSDVETFCDNPFNYLLEPWALRLPLDYPTAVFAQLQPYLASPARNFPQLDPVAIELAHEVWYGVDGDVLSFLSNLNQRIYETCRQIIRETGDPLPPGLTWAQKEGSCRDMALLFMEVCRAMGLATRFVSGYQEGDPGSTDLHLHAWAEVYLPGGGWRGYDPTRGLAVSDRHIALVASPTSHYAAPIFGLLKTGIGAASEMSYQLGIERDEG